MDWRQRLTSIIQDPALKGKIICKLFQATTEFRHELFANDDDDVVRASLLTLIESATPVHAMSTGLEGGMQIELESGTPVESDHPLSQFVACLRDPTLQKYIIDAKSNSVIELPKGIVWLGDKGKFSNQLFIRPCYFDLLEAKEEYFKLNNTLSTVVYTWTPGIGKSHLCAFVVARKLIAGTVVFFEIFDKDVEKRAVYRLHLVSGVHSFKSPWVLDYVSPNKNAVYIVDGVFARFPSARVETQIFASPSEELYRLEKKSGLTICIFTHTSLTWRNSRVCSQLCLRFKRSARKT